MKVMDGFGRHLSDQYYKAGSSLEVVCEVCALITYIKESFGSLFVLYSIGYLYPNFFSWILFPFSGTQQILASCWYGNKSKKLSNHVQKMVSGNFCPIRNFFLKYIFSSILTEYSGSTVFSRLAITQVFLLQIQKDCNDSIIVLGELRSQWKLLLFCTTLSKV